MKAVSLQEVEVKVDAVESAASKLREIRGASLASSEQAALTQMLCALQLRPLMRSERCSVNLE